MVRSTRKLTINLTDREKASPTFMYSTALLESLAASYTDSDVASVNIETIAERESLGGTIHRQIMNKTFDNWTLFVEYARLRYN